MKVIIVLVAIFAFSFSLHAQNSVGIGTQTPHASAMLEVNSTGKGMLIPRMNTAERGAIAAPATGLMVYDTQTNSFWYHNGSAWVNLAAGGGGSGWGLTGNAGTNPATNFLGTTDNRPIRFRVNNRTHGGLDTLKNVFLGDAAGASLTEQYNEKNIAIGNGALFQNTGAWQMIAIGDSAMAYSQSKAGDISRGYNNTAIGINTLKYNNGDGNTAVGAKGLEANVWGNLNTALGYAALASNVLGENNTAVGTGASLGNSTGSGNAAFGYSALYQNKSGRNNVAMGSYAANKNEMGHANVAIGTFALYNATNPSYLVAVGDSALYNNGTGATNNTQGSANTAIGSKALVNNTIGFQNSAIGYNALIANTTGSNNTAHGSFALRVNNTGIENTAVGRNAMNNNTQGEYNVALGSVALINNIDGDFNTAVGVNTLSSNTGGNGATAVGFGANVSAGNLLNATAIGYNCTVNASNKIRLGSGNVTVIEGQVNYTTSDGRFKKNMKDNVPGLDFITALKPLTYQYKSFEMEQFITQQNPMRQAALKQSDFAEAESMVHMGFIAQDVEKLVKEKGYNLSLVHAPTNPTDNYSIAYGELIVPLVKAVQEQQAIIAGLQKISVVQNGLIEALQKRIDQLEKK